MFYQAPDNSLHFIEPEKAYLLPPGSTPISNTAAAAIQAAAQPTNGAPAAVDMAQARLALLQAGLLSNVNAAVAAMTGTAGDAARIEWEFRATVRRDSPLVAGLSSALGLTSTQLDDLFTLAATL